MTVNVNAALQAAKSKQRDIEIELEAVSYELSTYSLDLVNVYAN